MRDKKSFFTLKTQNEIIQTPNSINPTYKLLRHDTLIYYDTNPLVVKNYFKVSCCAFRDLQLLVPVRTGHVQKNGAAKTVAQVRTTDASRRTNTPATCCIITN